eukprot:scaffold529863_cov14-Prasinocladus_malaysianus.AAC.1
MLILGQPQDKLSMTTACVHYDHEANLQNCHHEGRVVNNSAKQPSPEKNIWEAQLRQANEP